MARVAMGCDIQRLLASPQRIDRYLLDEELGRGAFGAVYRATHAVMGRKVALKVLHPERSTSPSVLERFLGEARAVAAIGSPSIVQVFDAGLTADGKAFVVMELLEGDDLAAHLAGQGRLTPEVATQIAREVCRGLEAAHRAGVIHRDLKPANIFLSRGPDGRTRAKILDFGVSKVARPAAEELTMTGTILGTPHYMAPEQLLSSKTVDHRADLYALGVVLYEMLAGRLPHEASTIAGLIAAKTTEPPKPFAETAPDVPGRLVEVILRLLSLNPDDRFESAEALGHALEVGDGATSRSSSEAAPLGLTFTTLNATLSAAPARWALGSAFLAALSVLGLLAAAVVAAVALMAAKQVRKPPASVGSAVPAPPPIAAPTPPAPAAPIAAAPSQRTDAAVEVVSSESSAGMFTVRAATLTGDPPTEIEERVTSLLSECSASPGYYINVETRRFAAGGGAATVWGEPHGPFLDSEATRCILASFDESLRELGPGTGTCRFEVAVEVE